MSKVSYDAERGETYGYSDEQEDERYYAAEKYLEAVKTKLPKIMLYALEEFMGLPEVKEAHDMFGEPSSRQDADAKQALLEYMRDFAGDYLFDRTIQTAYDTGGRE